MAKGLSRAAAKPAAKAAPKKAAVAKAAAQAKAVAAKAAPKGKGKAAAASMVDCAKVAVRDDAYGGAGAYALVAMKSGEEVERGIVRVLTNCDGNENPYVFTWSDAVPNKTWAIGSGCSTFYNTCADADANTHMERDFKNNSFVIHATRDIAAGDELRHVYKSKSWRTCFSVLKE